MLLVACVPYVQRCPHSVITGGVKAIERCRAMPGYSFGDLRDAFARPFRASDFHDMNLISVGKLILRRSKATNTFVADGGGCRRVGSKIAYQHADEKRLVVRQDIEDGELFVPRMFMELTGDIHE